MEPRQKAIKLYKKAIRIDPDDVMAHLYLGNAYCFFGSKLYPYNFNDGSWRAIINRKKAIESYKQAIEIDPDFALAHYALGRVYNIPFRVFIWDEKKRANERDSAIEHYKILKKLDTELANKLFNLIYK